jgi:lipoprotein
MKKVLVLVTLLLGIGIVAGCMNTPSKEKMNEELQKPEVAAVIEENLKNLDNNAFT